MVSEYYRPRPEVLALVPAQARRIVDVGCGTGLLGRALKEARPGVSVYGVEPIPAAADQARAVLDDVFTGPAAEVPPDHWPAPDCIVFADVLEHMLDPWAVLTQMASTLAPNGTVIISLPNVLHHSASFRLFRGRWDYGSAGILDRTHMRFFTRTTAFELVRGAGLEIASVQRVLSYPDGVLARTALWLLSRPRAVIERFHGLSDRGIAWLDVLTLQYLIVARAAGRPG